MKKIFFFISLLLSINSFSAESLPLGGKIVLSKSWTAKKLKTNGREIMIIFNKNIPDLQGIVLDGNPKIKESCNKVKKENEWVVCSLQTTVAGVKSYQYILERKIGEKGYQSYNISFNVSKKHQGKVGPIFKEFETSLGVI